MEKILIPVLLNWTQYTNYLKTILDPIQSLNKPVPGPVHRVPTPPPNEFLGLFS